MSTSREPSAPPTSDHEPESRDSDGSPAARLVRQALAQLQTTRKLFHSEADFQHALAWEFCADSERVRLEIRPNPDEPFVLDLLVTGPLGRIAIELKYVTRALKAHDQGEKFSLRNHSAHDGARYDIVKDLERLEHFVRKGTADHGVAVVLTNVAGLWEPATNPGTLDAAFRIHDGAVLAGTVGWAPGAGSGTTKGREKKLTLRGSYTVCWEDYATVNAQPGGRFRVLVVAVEP